MAAHGEDDEEIDEEEDVPLTLKLPMSQLTCEIQSRRRVSAQTILQSSQGVRG